MLVRLQKIIADAVITSRRKAEELILQGRVAVNGQAVTELGSKADPARDHVKVDGKLLRRATRLLYLLLNKPVGYVSTVSDPQRRPTVISLVKNIKERVYPVGRLDFHSSGLLLLTNDGELANLLMSRAAAIPRNRRKSARPHHRRARVCCTSAPMPPSAASTVPTRWCRSHRGIYAAIAPSVRRSRSRSRFHKAACAPT